MAPWCMVGGGDTEFYPKMARPPTSYDVTSRNHSNRFSPNLRQNVSKGYVYSYCKRQVLIKKIVLKKLKKNLMRGVDANPPSPVRLSFRLKVKPCAQLFSLKWRIQRVVSYHMQLCFSVLVLIFSAGIFNTSDSYFLTTLAGSLYRSGVIRSFWCFPQMLP